MEKQIIQFFEKEFGIDINENTKFFIDTGIDGDDGERFRQKFGDFFSVNMSNFIISKYFFSENEILNPFKLLFGKKDNIKAKPFLIYHLINVINRGHWFDLD
jgi:hypothetical protein